MSRDTSLRAEWATPMPTITPGLWQVTDLARAILAAEVPSQA